MMKVILATDGSGHAKEAAIFLAHLPHADKLELTVLVVSNAPNLRGAIVDATVLQQIERAEQLRAEATFQQIEEIFEGANAVLNLVVSEGHVGTTIVQHAQEQKADLIVIGAIGHSLFERMLGSISDFVATHATCSVLVVRPTGLVEQRRPIDICVAYDESDSAAVAVEQLSHFGWGATSKIDVVGVVTIPFVYSEIPYEFDLNELKATKVEATKRASERLQKLSPNVTTHIIDANHIGDGIVDFANKRGSDLIVMGSTGLGLLGRFLLGSVSRYVLRHAKCSVWIARAPIALACQK